MRLLFVGDVMLGRLVNDALRGVRPDYPWGNTLALFRGASWRMCNLECAVSDRGAPWAATPKAFHFRTDAKNVEVLKAAQIDAVSLANNHALDYGEDALVDTLDHLDAAGISRAGAGRHADEAAAAAMSRAGESRIGVIAFTDNMAVWEAGEKKPGVCYVPVRLADDRAQALLRRIEQVAKEVDVLVVSCHWGPNWGYAPPREHVELGRAIIDHGADVVFGHSAHVFRGIEFYHGKPILYSTGDFIDDYAVDPSERNDWSFVFVAEADAEGGWRLKLHPTVIRRFQARKAKGDERSRIVDKMRALCGSLGTAGTWNEAKGRLELQSQPRGAPRG